MLCALIPTQPEQPKHVAANQLLIPCFRAHTLYAPPQLNKIVAALPVGRQSLCFSATVPPALDAVLGRALRADREVRDASAAQLMCIAFPFFIALKCVVCMPLLAFVLCMGCMIPFLRVPCCIWCALWVDCTA